MKKYEKQYWHITVDRTGDGFITAYLGCPKCKYIAPFAMLNDGIPSPKFCGNCGKRLYVNYEDIIYIGGN